MLLAVPTQAISADTAANRLHLQLSRCLMPGEFRISLSNGMLMYQRENDLSIQAEYFPMSEWGQSYCFRLSKEGRVEDLKKVMRTTTVETKQNLACSQSHHLSQQTLSPNSAEWSSVIQAIHSGLELYSS